MQRVILHCPKLGQQRSLEECQANCIRHRDVRAMCPAYYSAIGHTSKEIVYQRQELANGLVELWALIPGALFPLCLPKKAPSTNSREVKKLFGARNFKGRVFYHYTGGPHALTAEQLKKARKRQGRVIITDPCGWVAVPSTVGTAYDEAFRLEWKLEKNK